MLIKSYGNWRLRRVCDYIIDEIVLKTLEMT